MANKIIVKRVEGKYGVFDENDMFTVTRKLGAFFEGKAPAKGVKDDEEEEQFLPQILGINKADSTRFEKYRNFWNDFMVEVPYEGLTLDVSTDKSGNPKNIRDYITYKWLLKHPKCANDPALAENNSRFKAFLYDPEAERKEKINFREQQEKASKLYHKVVDDTESNTTQWVLKVHDGQTQGNPEDDKNRLWDIAKDSPAEFIQIAEDNNLESKAYIMELLANEIINKEGNKYRYMDEYIGHDLESAVAWWNDQNNSSKVLSLKSKLDATRKEKQPYSG